MSLQANSLRLLHEAYLKGNETRMKQLLATHPQPEEASGLVLTEAARDGNLPFVRLMLGRGVDVNWRDFLGRTALALACASRRRAVSVARVLLDAGATLEGDLSFRLLHLALKKGNVGLTERLLKLGALDEENWRGESPMLLAVTSRKIELVDLLVAHGAAVNACDGDRLTPLHEACSYHGLAVAKVLLANGATVNVKCAGEHTPLMLACAGEETADSLELVRMLLEHGAQVNVRDSVGETALHRASAATATAVVKALLASGAEANTRSDAGLAPLSMACLRGGLGAARLLVASGADVGERLPSGETLLWSVVAQICTDRGSSIIPFSIVELLVMHGAQLDATAASMNPLLTSACNSRKCNPKMVDLLIRSGADVNYRSSTAGATPLWILCHRRSLGHDVRQALDLLLSRAPDADAGDDEGRLPLAVAAQNGCLEVAELLVERHEPGFPCYS